MIYQYQLLSLKSFALDPFTFEIALFYISIQDSSHQDCSIVLWPTWTGSYVPLFSIMMKQWPIRLLSLCTISILIFCVLNALSRSSTHQVSESNEAASNKPLTDDPSLFFNGSYGLGASLEDSIRREKWFYYNRTAYDYYSIREKERNKPLSLWERFSLKPLKSYSNQKTSSGLAFVQSIMLITGRHLRIRHEHIKQLFLQQGIPISAIEYRSKWNKENCRSPCNFEYIRSIFPYIVGNHTIDVGCSTVMEHIDAWYSIAKRNLSFAIIMEDDVTFVPFFKEKFNRFMYEAAKRQLIKVDLKRHSCSNLESKTNISIDYLLENPALTEGVFHFGSCQNSLNPEKNASFFSQVPRFIPFRQYNYGRCAHMYGMTHCAAKIMVKVLQKFPANYQWIDWLINYTITRSSNLIGWWPDPPLGYQIKEMVVVGDLPEILKGRTYGSVDTPPVL